MNAAASPMSASQRQSQAQEPLPLPLRPLLLRLLSFAVGTVLSIAVCSTLAGHATPLSAAESSWLPPAGSCSKAPSSNFGRRRTHTAAAALPFPLDFRVVLDATPGACLKAPHSHAACRRRAHPATALQRFQLDTGYS